MSRCHKAYISISIRRQRKGHKILAVAAASIMLIDIDRMASGQTGHRVMRAHYAAVSNLRARLCHPSFTP